MRKKSLLYLFILCSFLLSNHQANACTTFCLNDGEHLIFGRNFDFPVGYGHLLVNKKNLHKSAMVRPPEKPFKWTSKYGSVTFNQNGREFPFGGINEKGLIVEQMALNNSEYEAYDERLGLTELQWIQYQLDNSATVEEVLASEKKLRISPQSVAKLHFLVADKSGDVASIEFIGGKMVVHRGDSLPVKALANDSYDDSMKYLESFEGFGGTKEIPTSTAPLDRFVNAAAALKVHSMDDPINYAFEILERVAQADSTTQWSIVYDLKNMEIRYKTQKNSVIRELSLSDLNFDCELPVQFVDIDEGAEDILPLLSTFSYDENETLINRVWNEVEFLAPLPVEVRKMYMDYPEKVRCVSDKI